MRVRTLGGLIRADSGGARAYEKEVEEIFGGGGVQTEKAEVEQRE